MKSAAGILDIDTTPEDGVPAFLLPPAQAALLISCCLSFFLFLRSRIAPSEEFYLTLKFNLMSSSILVLQYFFSWTYIITMTALVILLIVLTYRVLSFENNHEKLASAGTYNSILLLGLAHAVYHDQFMLHEEIVTNGTVDSLLHIAMAYMLIEHLNHTSIITIIIGCSIWNTIQAFSVLDMKYSDFCDKIFFGSDHFDMKEGCGFWIGGLCAWPTIILATLTVAKILSLGVSGQHLRSDKQMLIEMFPYFFSTTMMYFLTDALFVVDLYELIKYDQLYYITGFLYPVIAGHFPHMHLKRHNSHATAIHAKLTCTTCKEKMAEAH